MSPSSLLRLPGPWARWLWLSALGLQGVACGAARYSTESGHPALVAPAKIAEGDTGKPAIDGAGSDESEPAAASSDATKPGNASPSASESESASPPALGYPPDPPPIETTKHYEYEFSYDQGQLSVARVRTVSTEKPRATARMMGRFAVELWLGPELVDRVRFDFPLLGAETPPGEVAPLHSPPKFGAGAVVTRTVVVPQSDRATSARLVDRATGEELELDWPPQAPTSAPEAAASSEP